MNKVFGVISLALVVSFFFLVSVAGENSRADEIIGELFIKLKNEDFSSECIKVVVGNAPNFDSQCDQDMFVFTVSLLKRFDLRDGGNFSINLKKENYWFPFTNNQGIRVSLNLSQTEKSSFFKLSNDLDYVKNLFVIKRTGFKWQIDSITINDPDLVKIFNDTKKQINFKKYLVQLDSGYQLNEIIIHGGEFTDIDRLLLKFSVEKLLKYFESQKPNKLLKRDSQCVAFSACGELRDYDGMR
ncbi:hypothetical protein [Vibrio navarrensis]|uniref:hypothetical protein n=3 Tax=Vibrio TaxID=662 RepID=UPI001D054D87|nr:hypothetical protein [Vibrio navarrensis]MBE4609655.1 hypothetical protein [Vibrio navarrensis]MBE4613376.1 hypothetical protein [Vibrio navarrensis]